MMFLTAKQAEKTLGGTMNRAHLEIEGVVLEVPMTEFSLTDRSNNGSIISKAVGDNLTMRIGDYNYKVSVNVTRHHSGDKWKGTSKYTGSKL